MNSKISIFFGDMVDPVQISDSAKKEIKEIMANKNIPEGYGLRIGVKGGGCGVSFILGFDKEKENDHSYSVDKIPVFVQKREMMFLVGKIVDFYEGADARGFVFVDNDKATSEKL